MRSGAGRGACSGMTAFEAVRACDIGEGWAIRVSSAEKFEARKEREVGYKRTSKPRGKRGGVFTKTSRGCANIDTARRRVGGYISAHVPNILQELMRWKQFTLLELFS